MGRASRFVESLQSDRKTVDLNHNWNWNYNNAYFAKLNASANSITYSNSLGTSARIDAYGEYILQNSNTYGWSFSDLVSTGGVNPLINLSPTGTNAAVLNVTLFANGESLPATARFKPSSTGYTPPTGPTRADGLPGYTAASVATFGQGSSNTLNAIQADFHLSVGGKVYAPDKDTQLVFKFFAPGDSQADKTTGFVSLLVPTTGAGNLAGDWNYYNLDHSTGKWVLTPTNPGGLDGFLQIQGVPVTSDGTAAWYQVTLGQGDTQTVYNFYAKSDPTTHNFLPITGAGSASSNFVIDQGALVQQDVGSLNYKLIMANAGNPTYDISTFTPLGSVRGATGDDVLNGTSGDDSFFGGGGNDTLNGAAGNDTVGYFNPSTDYAVKLTVGNPTITVQDKVGIDGLARLNSVENIKFSDETVSTTWLTKTASLPVDQIMKVVDLYTAGLNRAPDAVGLDYWASRLADGATVSDISKAIFSSGEAASIYSSTNSNPTLVNLAYQTAFGHAADAAGAAYWVNELNTGHLQRTDFLTALIAGARGPGGNAADAQYVANKEAVGAHFALTDGLNNINSAKAVEAIVNGTAASVTAANAQTDAFAVTAATAAGAELVVQIVGLVP